MGDPTALQIFIWLLIGCDYKTGMMATGRHWASQELKIKPRTFHKALTERLRDRYNLVTLSSDNKNTIVYIKNWIKYQALGDSPSDKPVTTKGQQSDNKVTLINNIRSKDTNNIYTINEDDMLEISKDYNVPLSLVKSSYDDLVNYCESKGKRYKNYKAALRNFVKRNAISLVKEEKYGTSRRAIDASNL